MSVRSLVLRFVFAGLVALIVVAVVTAWASRRVGTDLAITDAQRAAWVTGIGAVEPVLDDALLHRDRDALERLDAVVRKTVLRGSLVRIKIWTRDGTIVYADEPRLIGERFQLGEDEAALFDMAVIEEVHAEVSDLGQPENRFETETKLLEAYLPLRTAQGTPLLYEVYFRYEAVTEVGRNLWRRFAPLAIGALVVLELVQIPFAWQMARRLRQGQQHRERLLRHAIDASDAERRRIASDLHDGVVQDLTGVSLSLTAATRSGITDQRVGEAAVAIREGVKSLRSLLVDIYPPNLYSEGLESALGDLLGHLTNRGVATRLTVAVELGGLGATPSALLYRSAQEAVRNIAAHAQATAVSVEVFARESAAVLVIDDNGRGFDPDRLAARQSDGHVGLRVLAGLVRDAGGRLMLRSAPGEGTTLEVSIPRGDEAG